MINKTSDRGSVTVFLCLMSGAVMLLIVSLISVMRFRWEKTHIVRSANISTQAEFSKFYRPLYDNYRMFYYIETDDGLLEAGINGYFIKNQRDMPKLLALTLSDTCITDKKYAVDGNSYNVKKQMTEAVKYALGEKVFDEAVGKGINNEAAAGNTEILEETAEDIDNIKEEAETEAKVLELLKSVEGVSVSGGDIKCADHFVKEGISGEVDPFNAGVDSDIIWNKTKNKYTDIMKLPQKLKKIAEKRCSGGSAVFPAAEIKEWKNMLAKVREMTVYARNTASEINSRVGEFNESKMICNTVTFEMYLNDNIHILDKALKFADIDKPSCKDEWKSYKNMVEDVIELLGKYHVKELRFDYSTLKIKKQPDPRKGVGRKVGGTLNLLLEDDKRLSTKAVNESDIYYKLMKEDASGKADTAIDLNMGGANKEEYMFDDNADCLGQFVGDCRNAGLKQADSNIPESVGVSLYIDMFFECFLTDKSIGDCDKVLDYEREYIIAGKGSDEQNLSKTAGEILMLRTGMSMVHILSDYEKRNKAYIAAASIVGFTGMDAMVRIVQYSIIAAWAYEDACVDVALLLAGKKVPYIKNNASMNVSFAEMPLFGRELIKKKIMESDCVKGMDYDDYINALLLARKTDLKTCRAMDIIQYNIKKNYSGRFSFQDALYAAAVKISCSKPFESSAVVSYSYE